MSMKISDIEFFGSVYKKGGTSSQFLKADGSIDSSAYITLGSLSVTAPLTYNSGTGAFNINQASATTSGWLSYDDWVAFNGKQAAGSYVTTNTTQSISGAKTFTTQLWIGANAVIGSTNGQLQFDAAASSDLFISCIPSTRTVQIRNGNSGAPNYAACGLITGYIELRNNLFISTADNPSSNNISLSRTNDGNLINAVVDSINVMGLIVGGQGSPTGPYSTLTIGKNGYDKIALSANGNSYIRTEPTFGSGGNYGLDITNNITVSGGSTFSNGGVWGSIVGSNLVNWNGSNTINTGATMAGHIVVNRHIFKNSGITITCTQSTGIRATAALQVLQQTGGSFAGTVTHGAGLFIQGVYPTTASNSTFTNYYGMLINPLDEWGGVTLTNRWGIYQAGASDKNYLAGNLGVGKLLNTWGGSLSALQVGTRGVIWGRDSDGLVVFGNNSYFDGTFDKQILTGHSNRIYFLNGQMVFETAASTSAGSNTPWATTMTISAANEITSWNGEMYFKRSAFDNYGHIYCGSDRHFYLRNSGAYNMYLQTNGVNQIILQNDGVTKISNLRTDTLYTEFANNLNGTYNSGTWYSFCNSSQLTTGGMFVVVLYYDTYATGGGTYFYTVSSVPFYWPTVGSNSGDTIYFPPMIGVGHHGYGAIPSIRFRLEGASSGGKQYLEFNAPQTFSASGVGGGTVTWYVKRLGA